MEKIYYNSLNSYLRRRFGCKVYKLAIDGGFSCPNRDGRCGTKGCIFCSEGGSGDFAQDRSLTITDQLNRGMKLVESKMPEDGSGRYIAYFQAFTNTYAKVSVLREKYMEAVNHPKVVAVSIATRPDCIDKEIIGLLKEINAIKPVWVELGLQTIHEASASYIRRGYDLSVYDSAVEALSDAGIEIITHVILGLPGETDRMMLETVKYVANSKVQGIKLQLLHVLKGTDLAKDYEAGKFECLTEEEYVDIVARAVALLPDTMVVHRLTGDGDKKILIAPEWSKNKKHVLASLSERLCAR